MPPESNGPNISLPNASALDSFLEGAEDNSTAEDTAYQAEEDAAVETPEQELPAGDTFDRKYVEKLRKESASYRERAKKYESVFEGYEEGAVDEWRQMIEGFKADPKSVAEQWKDLSTKILEQFSPAEQEVIEDALNDEEKPLTMSQLQSILDQRQNDQELERTVHEIEREAVDLGYNLKSREYKILLMTAQNIPSGDIAEAHAMIQAEKQAEFDKRIAELEKQGGSYRRPSDMVGVPSKENQIKDFAQAKEALSNYLDGQFK